MRRALVAALAIAALAAIVSVRSRAPRDDAARSAAAPAGPATQTGDAVSPHGAARDDERLARPRSLRGTRVDGGLAVGADGRFVPTIDARRLFDYFLSATGELPPEALRARIVREIERRLAPDAARDAVALLDRYLAYRERVRGLPAGGTQEPADLEGRFATVVALRREMLGPDAADAFFADDEAQARRVLEIRRIAADPALSAEERARRVEALYAAADADLPPEVRESRAAGRLATTIREAEDEVRANGGGPAEVQALRERLAGPEVAARLAELDEHRARWLARVEAFRANRARLESDPSLGPAERAAAIQGLFERSFTTAERRRVEALDRLAAGSDAPVP